MTLKSILLGAALALVAGTAAANDTQATGSGAIGELNFRFDSAALMESAPTVLNKVAAFATANPDSKIVLDAHCDPTGASTYNVKLAIRRAESVRDRLKTMGVPEDRIVFAVYGEDGAKRASYAEDRRVTIWSTREPLATVIDRTFAGKGEAVTWQDPMTVAQIEGTDKVATK
ncbi:MAG TPA: OmpA family protein [Kofleriaceae bacterium]|nr:OmpA family protein [Kofleriaceae bacterium]